MDDSVITLQTISALGTRTSDAFHAATNLTELLRSATRHVRRLVGAGKVRIWIARRGGRRLVARDFLRQMPPSCQCRFDVLAVYYESHRPGSTFELFQNAFSVSYNH